MEYYTIDSKVIFERDKMFFRNIKYDPNGHYWFVSFALLAILLGWNIYDVVNGEIYSLLWVVIILVWIYPHLVRIYKFLFVQKWGNAIKMNNIKDVTRPEPINELETKVILKLKSGRRKELIFRSRENQVEGFLETIQQFNSNNFSIVPASKG